MIYIASDVHIVPEGKREKFEGFLEEARAHGEMLVLAGDIYDLARYPLMDILQGPDGGRYHQQLILTANRIPTTIIEGNHDFGLAASRELLPSAFQIRKGPLSLDNIPGRPLILHGWQEYDVSLAPLAPFYSWLFPHFPRWVYLYDRVFATPSVVKKQSLPRFYRTVLRMHYRAMADAMARDRTIIWGHTHWRGVWPVQVSPQQTWVMANAGDFVDGPGGLVLNPRTGFVHVWKS